MPLVYPTGYYDRTDPTKYYDKHLFRADYVLQGAELNEIQSEAFARIRGMGDALFKDGAVIKNAQIVIDPATGETQCEAGIIYLAGKLYGVPAATITLPITGTLQVGVYLVSSIIDETADTGLRDPAITAALASLGRNGVPVYVFYRPGKPPVVLTEVLSVDEVRATIAQL